MNPEQTATRNNLHKPTPKSYLEQPTPHVRDRQLEGTPPYLRPSPSEPERESSATSRIKEAAEPVRRAGRSASDTLAMQARSNPVPLALIAAGAAWLVASNSRTVSRVGNRIATEADSTLGSALRSAGNSIGKSLSDLASGAQQARDSAKVKVDEAKEKLDSAGRRLSSQADVASARMSEAGSAAAGKLLDARDRINDSAKSGRQLADQAAGSISRLYREQPVALALVGLAAGAVIGALMPRTRREDQLFGEYSDRLTEKARQGAVSELEAAKEKAVSRADTAVSKARESIRSADGQA